MTPNEALKKIDHFTIDLNKMVDSFCRDPTTHSNEFKNGITQLELYNKITNIQCRLIDLWDYIHKNRNKGGGQGKRSSFIQRLGD